MWCSKFDGFRWGYSAELAQKRERTRIDKVHGKSRTLLVVKRICAYLSAGSDKAGVRRHTNEEQMPLRRPSVSDDERGHSRKN